MVFNSSRFIRETLIRHPEKGEEKTEQGLAGCNHPRSLLFYQYVDVGVELVGVEVDGPSMTLGLYNSLYSPCLCSNILDVPLTL